MSWAPPKNVGGYHGVRVPPDTRRDRDIKTPHGTPRHPAPTVEPVRYHWVGTPRDNRDVPLLEPSEPFQKPADGHPEDTLKWYVLVGRGYFTAADLSHHLQTIERFQQLKNEIIRTLDQDCERVCAAIKRGWKP